MIVDEIVLGFRTCLTISSRDICVLYVDKMYLPLDKLYFANPYVQNLNEINVLIDKIDSLFLPLIVFMFGKYGRPSCEDRQFPSMFGLIIGLIRVTR